jgi:hypothetical protein
LYIVVVSLVVVRIRISSYDLVGIVAFEGTGGLKQLDYIALTCQEIHNMVAIIFDGLSCCLGFLSLGRE